MFAIIILFFAYVIQAAPWNEFNNPFVFGQLQSHLSDLPLTGSIKDKRLGWPGSHWANNLGGIAHRWSSGNPQNFSYRLQTLAELRKLQQYQLDELSPAEKFDIFNQNYTYPTVRKIFSTLSPNEIAWNGICHGYAPSSLNHPEPARVTLKNPDGIRLTFYSSDVAGLMSYYYAKVITTKILFGGKRCHYREGTTVPTASQEACKDLNAGAFHLILANKLGLEGVSFIADIERYLEVWNSVAVSYESDFLRELEPAKNSAPGTVRRVHVETIVSYGAEIAPKFDPVIGTSNAEYARPYYEYYLDLDEKDNIVGGEWISNKRPDFIWTQKKAYFAYDWTSLNKIYRPAKRQ